MEKFGHIFLSVAIGFAGLCIGKSIVQFKKLDQTADVRGFAERIVDANEATWQIYFSTASNDIADVSLKAKQMQDSIVAFLTSQGFATEEITREPTNVSDMQQEYSNNPKALRFTARGTVTLMTKKIPLVSQASQKTDELIKKSVVVSGSNLSYYFTALNDIKPEMLIEATKNAQQAAKSFADTAGAKLGSIKSASQGNFSISGPTADYDAPNSLKKKVRVVTQMKFYLN